MITFRERLKKPSAAIQAMIDGLKETKERDDVEIDMGFFFITETEKCFACAATATVMKATGCDWEQAKAGLAGDTGYLWPVFAEVLGPDVEPSDLEEFEWAMDTFRIGYPDDLFEYFRVDKPYLCAEWTMGTTNWEEQLPAVEAYRDQLIELGL